MTINGETLEEFTKRFGDFAYHQLWKGTESYNRATWAAWYLEHGWGNIDAR